MKNFIWYTVCSVLILFLWNHVAFALPSQLPTKPFSSAVASVTNLCESLVGGTEIDQQPAEEPNSGLPQDATFLSMPAAISTESQRTSAPHLSRSMFEAKLSDLAVVPNDTSKNPENLRALLYVAAIAFGDQNLQLDPQRFGINDYDELKTHPEYRDNSFALLFMILARTIVGMEFCNAAIFSCQLIANISIFYSAIMFLTVIETSFQSGGICQICK